MGGGLDAYVGKPSFPNDEEDFPKVFPLITKVIETHPEIKEILKKIVQETRHHTRENIQGKIELKGMWATIEDLDERVLQTQVENRVLVQRDMELQMEKNIMEGEINHIQKQYIQEIRNKEKELVLTQTQLKEVNQTYLTLQEEPGVRTYTRNLESMKTRVNDQQLQINRHLQRFEGQAREILEWQGKCLQTKRGMEETQELLQEEKRKVEKIINTARKENQEERDQWHKECLENQRTVDQQILELEEQVKELGRTKEEIAQLKQTVQLLEQTPLIRPK